LSVICEIGTFWAILLELRSAKLLICSLVDSIFVLSDETNIVGRAFPCDISRNFYTLLLAVHEPPFHQPKQNLLTAAAAAALKIPTGRTHRCIELERKTWPKADATETELSHTHYYLQLSIGNNQQSILHNHNHVHKFIIMQSHLQSQGYAHCALLL